MTIDSDNVHTTSVDAASEWQFFQQVEGVLNLHDATDSTSFELHLPDGPDSLVPQTVTIDKVNRFTSSVTYTNNDPEGGVSRSVVVGEGMATGQITGEPLSSEAIGAIADDLASYRYSTLAGAAFAGVLRLFDEISRNGLPDKDSKAPQANENNALLDRVFS